MDTSTARDIERDCAFGSLFQQIINEMKNSSPLWEDLTSKSTKLHSCLRATIQAVSSFLDTFQKIADAATSTKGATKDIGTALTRICLRHKALEAKLKTFTSSIMDCLIIPLQERLEEWKRTTINLDKEHSKEYKRTRGELKKRTIDTLRLQKKLRKGGINNGGMSSSFTAGTLQRPGGIGNTMSTSSGGEPIYQQGLAGGNRELHKMLEIAMRDTSEKRLTFEEGEKQAIRTALIEERSRFCLFVSFFKPVVDEEVSMLSELNHIQEAMQQLQKHTNDPFGLPLSSEQVIADLKGSCDSGTWSFQTPPSSPSSLGSRKSSMCSISSANSSSSGSAHSPSHNLHQRTILQQPLPSHPPVGPLRYSSVSSQDSGFTSQDTLFSRMPPPFYEQQKSGNQSEGSNTSSTGSSNSSTPSSPYPPGNTSTTNSTWPNLQDSIQFERAACAIMNERPHTISSAYERGHQRPPLTVYTFQGPSGESESQTTSPSSNPATPKADAGIQGALYQSASEIYGILRGRNEAKPPVPKRGSSLERPSDSNIGASGSAYPAKTKKCSKGQKHDANGKDVPVPDFNQSSPDMIVPQPVYVNMHELNQMAAAKRLRQQHSSEIQSELPPPPPELMTPSNKAEGIDNSMRKLCQTETTGDSRSPSVSGTIVGSGGSGSSTISVASSSTMMDAEVYEKLQNLHEKPQPPVRRTSSISASTSRNPSNASSPTSAVPPYQFVNQLNSQNQMSNRSYSISSNVTCQGSSNFGKHEIPQGLSENLPPPPVTLMSAATDQKLLDEFSKRVSVAETIKNLTEKNHQPVSPNMVRRSLSTKQAEELDGSQSHFKSKPNENWSNPKEKERSNLMQILNQKLSQGLSQPTYGHIGQPLPNQKQAVLPHQQTLPNQFYQQVNNQQVASQSASNSPRHPRRFSEELLKTTATFVQNRVLGTKTPPPVVSSKEMFVQTLNAKLSQMRVGSPPSERRLSSPNLRSCIASKLAASVGHHHHQKTNEISRAFRVRQWIASRTIADPNLCRESLMDQIRRGTKLRHTRAINDRSAPRIH